LLREGGRFIKTAPWVKYLFWDLKLAKFGIFVIPEELIQLALFEVNCMYHIGESEVQGIFNADLNPAVVIGFSTETTVSLLSDVAVGK
jgi:hypothetical protein